MCLCLQVSVDVFKGFPDEDSIVNYTLNQAYQDNVSVFASESLCPAMTNLAKRLFMLLYKLCEAPEMKIKYNFQRQFYTKHKV